MSRPVGLGIPCVELFGSRHPLNVGGIPDISSFYFHQLASNIIPPIYNRFIYDWCRSVLIPDSGPRNDDLNARMRLSTVS